MKQVLKSIFCLMLLLAVVLPPSAFAELITLQPGPAEGKDTFAWYRSGSTNSDLSNSSIQWTQHNSYGWNSIGYYQFDLSGLDASWTVTSAELELHHIIYGSSWPLSETEFTLKEVAQAWDQNTLNWYNQPALGNQYTSTDILYSSDLSLPPMTGNQAGVTTIDLTSLVIAWHTGTLDNNGFAYYMETTYGFSAQDHYIAASNFADSFYRPALTIEYEAGAAPVPEPATMLLLGTGLIGLAGARRRTQR